MQTLSRAESKKRLASIYDLQTINPSFIRGISANSSELHSTAISTWLDANPNTNSNSTAFWFGLWQSTQCPKTFINDTNTVKQALIDASCTILTDEFMPGENIRRITVVTALGTDVKCTCSILDGETYVVLRKVKNLSNSTHHISRFTSYYVNRALQTIETEST